MEKLNVAIADDNERLMRNSMSLELLKMGKRLTM